MNGREARESGLRLKACIAPGADLPATAILCGPSPQSGGLEAIGQNPQKQPQRQMGGTSLHVGTKGAWAAMKNTMSADRPILCKLPSR
jgi:hypothetical protein